MYKILGHGMTLNTHFWKLKGRGVVSTKELASIIGISKTVLIVRCKKFGFTSQEIFAAPKECPASLKKYKKARRAI